MKMRLSCNFLMRLNVNFIKGNQAIHSKPMINKIFRTFTASVLSTALSVPFTYAQEAGAAAEDTIQLEEAELVGTYLQASQANALKSPTPVLDVPQSLTIFTDEQIQLQGFMSIGDIINYTPGVNTSQGEGHRDSVVFRGVRSTADFYLDGIRDDVQYYRPLYNLEQVEILRGPNALLFGRGGTGGILNRVTKKGVIGDKFTEYRAYIDTFGETNLWLDTNFALDDNKAFRLNLLHENLKNHRDYYDGDVIGINPTFRMVLNEGTTLDVSYEYLNQNRFIDRGIPTGADGRPVEALKKVVFGDATQNVSEHEAHLLRAILEHQISDTWKARFSAFYGDHDKMYQNFYPVGYDPVADEVTLDGYLDTTQRKNTILSADLIGEFDTGSFAHTLVTGIEYIDTENNNDRYNSFFDQTADDPEIFSVARHLGINGGVGVNALGATTTNDFTAELADDTHADVSVFSAYIQDEIAINDKFDLVLGARFDSFEIDVFNVDTGEYRSRKDEQVTPRAGAIFKPKENASLYVSYSESFLPRSGEQYANINGDNNALDPDTFENLEFGAKWDLNDSLSLTASIFEIQQSSPQVADGDPATLDVIDSEINGFELQLQGWLSEKWYFSAGYSFLDGEQVNRSGPTGLRPRELPESMFSLWNNYMFTERLGVNVGVIYQDESFINNDNTASLPSYTRVDAGAFYDLSETFRVQLNVENLTDELYFPNAHSTHEATVGAPINAMLSVSGRF